MNINNFFRGDTANVFKWTVIVLMILAVFLGLHAISLVRSMGEARPHNSISVTGEGEAFAVPDVATFTFTVSVDASTVSAAQESVTNKANAILESLNKMGIDEKDIKTLDYSVWPKYVYAEASMPCIPERGCPPVGRQIPDGFTASHTVLVKVRKTDEAGKALALAGENGATNISSLSFTQDEPEKVLDEARAEAIADAREKAKALAKNLGVRLVRVTNYQDNSGGYYPKPAYEMGMGGDNQVRSIAPTLPVGENKVTVSVTVTYEIR